MSPEEFADLLDDVSEHCESGSFEDPLREVLPVLSQGFEQNFMRAEGPDGAPWKPRKDMLPHPLLILSGALIESVRDTGGQGNIHEVSARDIAAGVDTSVIEYAGVHQFGSEHIPARPYLYASATTLDAMADVFADAALEMLFG